MAKDAEPQLIAVTLANPSTRTGVTLFVYVCPFELNGPIPHAQTEPSDFSARLRLVPAATAVMPDKPGTWVKFARGAEFIVGYPSCPLPLAPEVQTVPSVLSTILWASPKDRATKLSRPVIGTGVLTTALFVSGNGYPESDPN